MEEASEFIDRVKNGGVLPMITSCSPGWVKFCEHYYPDLLGQPVQLQVPPEYDRRPHQDLVRPEGGHRPPEHRIGVCDALHRQKV